MQLIDVMFFGGGLFAIGTKATYRQGLLLRNDRLISLEHYIYPMDIYLDGVIITTRKMAVGEFFI